SRFAAREEERTESRDPGTGERAALEGDLHQILPVAQAQAAVVEQQGEQQADALVLGRSGGEMVCQRQSSQELTQAFPHVTELPGGMDGLALIHPAVDILVAGDDRPREGLDRGSVIAALAAR